jgi:hypothetical protein
VTWTYREADWELLTPGTTVEMVKRQIDGEDRARYPGMIQPTLARDPWVEIEALWTTPSVTQGPLTFSPGDVIREFYSWRHPYNAFSVYSPQGVHKGWYANVTYPSFIEMQRGEPVVIWQDMLLDVVADAAGEYEVLDEDELAASGLATTDPDLHCMILEARDEILKELRNRTGPFVKSLWNDCIR